VWRGTLGDAVEYAAKSSPRGEYVVVLGGAPPAPPPDEATIAAHLGARLAAGQDKRAAVAAVAEALGVPKRRVYDLAVQAPTSDEG
jgi:16S rRNA (cytidine1402-2'-O)-methyltransferase